MAFRCYKLLKTIRSASALRHKLFSTSVAGINTEKIDKLNEYRTEDNLIYIEDPNTFGTLSRRLNKDKIILEDKGDIQEELHVKNIPLPSQQLTTRQYAELIKQYLKHKRLKEALNVLEVRMLKEDRVKPENYIFNILIGACADVGYTKKAFSLYNYMKKRALKATGDTYTCLFHACSNSPFPSDGLKRATNLRELMNEKRIEPNLTNYNAMIKAFGRCGDLATAFKIVDEMVSKGIKIRVHTYNHLLQACISDKESGLRHALIVWRKMLKMREKPNIYSFNLMLKCVKECNMGTKADIEELISVIQDQMVDGKKKTIQIEQARPALIDCGQRNNHLDLKKSRDSTNDEFERTVNRANDDFSILSDLKPTQENNNYSNMIHEQESIEPAMLNDVQANPDTISENKPAIINTDITLQIVKLRKPEEKRIVPNLLSKELKMEHVLSLQEVSTVQDKFAVIGGQEDFLKEMKAYSVPPDIKTFTQILPLLEETVEAENKLLETMKAMDLKADIDFYNMLIKKRCLRSDYDAAFEVKNIIEKESKRRKRRYPLKKKLRLRTNIMTYGVLAMACKTRENAEKLLNDMKEEHLKVNIEILGTLLRQGTANFDFGYVMYIMRVVQEDNIQVNHIFLKHLEAFKEKSSKNINSRPREKGDIFLETYRIFSKYYTDWLKNINVEEVLKPEHPWAQFKETHPETVQREHFKIEEPRKFYKQNRKFERYQPPIVA